MEELFKTIRESCSPRTWSRAVELARGGAVVLLRENATEARLRVSVPGQTASPTATLWPDEEDWSCDCAAAEDPCAHVAAAAIALKRGNVARSTTGDSTGPVTARVAYRFHRAPEGLSLTRVLLRGREETPLTGTLVQLASGDQPGRRVAASKADLAAELALGQRVRGGVLPAATMRALLLALDEEADVQVDGTPVTIGSAEPAVYCELRDDGEGFCLQAKRDGRSGERFRNGVILAKATLHPTREPDLPPDELRALLSGQHFPPQAAGRLAMEILPRLRTRLPLEVRTKRLPEACTEPPRLAIELSRINDQLRLLPTLVYGHPTRARLDGTKMTLLGPADAAVPLRDERAEQRLRERLHQRFELHLGRARLVEPTEAIPLLERLRGAAAEVELLGEAQHEFFRTAALQPQLEVGEQSFSLTFGTPTTSAQGRSPVSISARAVIEAWQGGYNLVGLPGGGFAPLPADWLERYGQRIQNLLLMQSEEGRVARAGLPDLARLCEDLDTPAPASLSRLRHALEDFTQIPPSPQPEDLTVELRPYQREGIAWLAFMRQTGLGALLADDMGLGKTLQALCALQPGKPALVVAPTSVLGNWQNEIARFRPALRPSLYHGAGRKLDESADVVLTSYALLRLDLPLLTRQHWDTVILDEAQNIRNPESQVAQAAYQLQADWRIALSGTPVENRLDDLWSQFHFLNRGLLGGRADFAERYARPIAEGRRGIAVDLRHRTRPFILRRLKSQVERQLPPRIEVILRCELNQAERDLYDAIQAATRDEVLKQLQLEQNVLAALTALLRLRQAACHSALVPGQRATSSSKLELLVDQLEETCAEGHKALVFSQWTSLLDLVEPALTARQLDFLRLDGTTRDRQQVVNDFQGADGAPILLISLKAGGVGLNLTAADHVFLMDPWWNPATEDQAADRAHRIGQTKPVIVHKLVAQDTVEERILALQSSKRALADAALEGADQVHALSRNDLLQLLG